MGLAVAQYLTQTPPANTKWSIHILDVSPERGQAAASSINATFHASDVTSYTSLSKIFQTIFTKERRIDFVFANAGIAEHADFFSEKTSESNSADDTPPPEPTGLHALVDINLKSVISTSSLALHYMRKTPANPHKSLIMTASCGGLYPSYYSPIYTATKHGVIGFARAIAPYYFHKGGGIRVNAICPGTVKTNLLSGEEWKQFPESDFTPVEKIAKVVGLLVGGVENGEGRGKVGSGEKGDEEVGELWGKAVEVCGEKHYYREQVEFCDESMRRVMGATNV